MVVPGPRARFALAFAVLLLGAVPGFGQVVRPQAIDRNGVLILIRTTLVAVQQANQTGNYGVLHGISAPGFQAANSPGRLVEIFAGLRGQNFDLSGVAVLEPQLTVLPEVDANGVMRMAGYFPSVPLQVSFDLQFTAVENRWRLLGISVNVGPPVPNPPPTEAVRVQPKPAEPARAPAASAPRPTRPAARVPQAQQPEP